MSTQKVYKINKQATGIIKDIHKLKLSENNRKELIRLTLLIYNRRKEEEECLF